MSQECHVEHRVDAYFLDRYKGEIGEVFEHLMETMRRKHDAMWPTHA